MRRYVLTGAPGAGKTSILLELQRRGHVVVTEAATDVIADASRRGVDRHWEQPGFIDRILAVQCERQAAPAPPGKVVQFYDRSPMCTLALAEYLGHPVPDALVAEIDRIERTRTYERQAFLVRDLGFVERTDARRISFEESLEFERVHITTYRSLGYDLVNVPRGAVVRRADLVEAAVASLV